MSRLGGKVAIVTGGAQGIGATFAKGLAAEGAAVCVVDLGDTAATVGAIAQAGGKAMGVRADITDSAAVSAMVAKTVDRFGTVHILINNAAICGKVVPTPFTELKFADWEKIMKVNVWAQVECIKACLPAMRQQKYGKVVNMASASALKGSPYMLHYVSSKGAVIAMTRAIAREVGGDGIRVNCIAPGFTLTESMLTTVEGSAQRATATNIAARAIKRDQVPEDLVGPAIYLASPESDFVTGQIAVVNGGDLMY